MILTEEEAKTKWCPFARVIVSYDDVVQQPVAFNRYHDNKTGKSYPNFTSAHCIASACAAWRWERGTGSSIVRTKDEMIRRDDGSVYFRPVPPDGDGWYQQWVDSKHANRRETGFTDWIRSHGTEEFTWGSPRKGHCGLAGEPK